MTPESNLVDPFYESHSGLSGTEYLGCGDAVRDWGRLLLREVREGQPHSGPRNGRVVAGPGGAGPPDGGNPVRVAGGARSRRREARAFVRSHVQNEGRRVARAVATVGLRASRGGPGSARGHTFPRRVTPRGRPSRGARVARGARARRDRRDPLRRCAPLRAGRPTGRRRSTARRARRARERAVAGQRQRCPPELAAWWRRARRGSPMAHVGGGALPEAVLRDLPRRAPRRAATPRLVRCGSSRAAPAPAPVRPPAATATRTAALTPRRAARRVCARLRRPSRGARRARGQKARRTRRSGRRGSLRRASRGSPGQRTAALAARRGAGLARGALAARARRGCSTTRRLPRGARRWGP